MNQRKSLKELNLLDKFLFDEAMDDQENVKTMLDIIFLNTRGKHPELVSSELIELLKYMERSTDEVSGECKSKRIQEMHRRVCQIKASEKTEVKYIQTWEEKILIKQEGIAEGKQIGVEQINRLNQRLIEQGRFDDLTKAASDKVYQEKLLKNCLINFRLSKFQKC